MGKYIVKYVENNVEKESKTFKDRDEAFLFQTSLLAKRARKEDGTWDIELKGIWNLSVPAGH